MAYAVTENHIVMYDSVTPGSLPQSTVKAAGFVNGDFPSHAGIAARFPHCRVFGIDVLGTWWEQACILDYEEGNPTWQKPEMVRNFVTKRNEFEAETAVVYCSHANLPTVEDYLKGLWHCLWVGNWGENGTEGEDLTGTRTPAGNLIVGTQVQNNKKANWDKSLTLASWR